MEVMQMWLTRPSMPTMRLRVILMLRLLLLTLPVLSSASLWQRAGRHNHVLDHFIPS
jgi:hypothetical protein